MTNAKITPPAPHRRSPRPSPQSWSRADADARRRLIVDAALAILRDDGLPAVTMRSVASRLGVGTMTLYTYVEGQHGLHREMVQRGFEVLHGNCSAGCACSTEADPNAHPWLGGARGYLRFAVENPSLYQLMFDHPMTPDDIDLIEGGIRPLLDRVTERLMEQGWHGPGDLPKEARRRAGRFWIALHGVAMLAIAGRLCVLEGGIDEVIEDLLPRVAPT